MRFFFCGALATAFLLSAIAPAAVAKKAAPSVAPSPSPSTAPSTLRTPGKSSFPPPVVVVFPLSVTGEADKEAGSRLGLLFATRFATSGGITIKPPPPGAEEFSVEFDGVEGDTIEIIPPKPTRPKDMDPKSDDERMLGVGLVYLKIQK